MLGVDDVRTVLLAQGVNKMFHGTIKGSTNLKRKLWLSSDSTDTTRASCKVFKFDHPSGLEPNPLLRRIRAQQGRFLELCQRPGIWNYPVHAIFDRGAFFGTGARDGAERKRIRGFNHSWLEQGAQSWRFMYLVRFDPDAVREIDLTINVKLSYVLRETSFRVDKHTKVQDLVDFMRTRVQKWMEGYEGRSVRRKIAS